MPAEGYGITYQSRGTRISDGKGSENLKKKPICEKSCNACICYQRTHALKFVLHSSHSVISKGHYTSLLNKAAFSVVVPNLRKAQRTFFSVIIFHCIIFMKISNSLCKWNVLLCIFKLRGGVRDVA